MSKLQTRSIQSNDLGRVSEIESLIAGHPRLGFLEKRFSAIASDPEHFITCAALDQGALVGYALAQLQAGEFGTREVVAVLDVIGVAPEAQGQGIGRALLGGIKAQMAQRGVGSLKTQISWADPKMVQFFSSVGFSLAPFQILERDTSPLEEKAEAAGPGTGDIARDNLQHVSDDYHDLSRDRVQVRSLRAEDLAEVVRIDHKLTGRDRTAYFSTKFREMLTESGIRVSIVAEDAGVLTGFIMARVDFGEFGKVEKTAVIDSIGVHPAFTGSGIGHALLSQLLLNLSTLQVEAVRTQVSPEDFGLNRFLHTCGFKQSQRLVLRDSAPAGQGLDAMDTISNQVGTLP